MANVPLSVMICLLVAGASAAPVRRILIQTVLNRYAFEQASHGGELAHAVEAGVLHEEDVTQLGAVLAGAAAGRGSDDEITLFDSTGLAIQDLAIALAALERVGELPDLARLEL